MHFDDMSLRTNSFSCSYKIAKIARGAVDGPREKVLEDHSTICVPQVPTPLRWRRAYIGGGMGVVNPSSPTTPPPPPPLMWA
mmetsp:Transcript_104300/g.179718  ORF Transcript_104300/g.179718 Transcript_104300/m.179718 type:complete len:82 (+) Transcript_104300:121-366(+)